MRCGLFYETRGKKKGSTKMTNACVVVSAAQNRSIPLKMNLIDYVTEKIDRFHVACDNEDADHNDRETNIGNPVKNEENKDERKEKTNKEEEEEEEEEEEDYYNSDEDDDNDGEENDEDDDLIERGPMRSQLFPLARNQPYNTDQSLVLNINDSALLGKGVENVLWERELQTMTKNIDWNCCADGNSQIVPQVCVSKAEFATLDVDDSIENLLLQNVMYDNFQADQRVSKNSSVYWLQEYRESSNPAFDQSTTSQINFSQSPIDFPANDDSYLNINFDPSVNVVVPANSWLDSSVHRPSQASSSRSSSSSSSSQSYADSSSPYNCQVPCNSQVEEQFDQDLANLPFWEQQNLENGTVSDDELLKMLKEFENLPETKLATDAEIAFPQTDNFRPDEARNNNSSAVDKLVLDPPSYCLSYSDLLSLSNSSCNGSSSTLVDNFQTTLTDDSYIPKILDTESCPAQEPVPVNRKSDRNALPWDLLNLPPGLSSAKLKEQVTSSEVQEAMKELLKRPDKELAQQDKDGDTMLMCLVGNADEFVRKKAYLAPLVERLSTMKGALLMANNRGEDALYLAAVNCPEFPYVVGYLAATMLQKNIDISQRLYHTSGNTLIHSVAARGDSHTGVLAELLALKTGQGNAVFDLSKRNYDGKTAMHVAVESQTPSLASVKLLLKHGANPRMRETRCDDTALHAACRICDPALVKVLLDACGSEFVNAMNRNRDTPLHVAAAASNKLSLKRQTKVCRLLIHSGGNANLANHQGKTPLDLLPPDRQETIGKIFYGRS